MDLAPILPTPRNRIRLAGTVSLPRPLTVAGAQRLRVLPAGMVHGDAGVRCVIDAALPAQGYRLRIDAAGVQLAAGDDAGVRHGLHALAQAVAGGGATACQEIADQPAFPVRGAMLDISRDRVPTMASLRELIDRLASWRMNHLQLYTEHTFAYAGHDDAWRTASPITPTELRELVAYALDRGIELAANQNCLGHCERWLRHPRYAALGEVAQPWMHGGSWYLEPTTLCPEDPGSLALVRDWLDQLLPLTAGSYANIGCDEPWELGQGRSRAACERDGRGAVFSRHVAAVTGLVRRHGKRAQFWCDPHPNEGDGLPRDLVALVWGYGATEDFAPRLAAHRAAGREVWVCPGTSGWNSFLGRTWNRRGNLRRAAADGLAHGATGYLVTEWGDGGHRQPWPVTLFGFAEGAQAAWAGAQAADDGDLGRIVFGSAELGRWLCAAGDADGLITRNEHHDRPGVARANHGNDSALFNEMNYALFDAGAGQGSAEDWQGIASRVGACAASRPLSGDALVDAELAWAIAMAQWAADRGVARRGQLTVPVRQELAARLCPLIAEYARLWRARSREGGLTDSLEHFRRVARWW